MLNAFEDELCSALGQSNAILVGRITGAGRRELYFYAGDSNGFTNAVHRVSAHYPDYSVDMGDQPDPEWSQYLNVLYPGPRDFQRIQNRRVIAALEAEGDVLNTPRPVTHWIYFAESAQRAVAAAKLSAIGFQTENTDPDTTSPAGDIGLRIERVEPVDEASIDATALLILDSIEGLGAEYDGWECPVMKAGPNTGTAPVTPRFPAT